MTDNLLNIWLILGVALLLIDMISMTIILLFGGLAALTVGSGIYFDLIASGDLKIQITIFFIGYFVWAIALWSPLQKLRNKTRESKYSDIIGSDAVIDDHIEPGKGFCVKWSGTRMKAKFAAGEDGSVLKKGDLVKVVSVKGTELTVTTK